MLKDARLQEDETVNKPLPHISVAPMMDWTDRHCRYFHRLLSPNVRLYTEMVTTGALIHGDRDRHLRFDASEKYVALQLGGSEPADLAECAKMGADYGYDEINLNCGCPSERVQKGAFGACLMAEPDLVARSVESMAKAVNIPVTVKCRIGIDECDPEIFLRAFVRPIADAGCGMFVVHARKAWLKGLSPKENRTKPPINYDLPAEIKREFPHLQIVVNGEVKTSGQVKEHLQRFDGVMIGREAYQNPGLLLDLEKRVFGNDTPIDPRIAVRRMIPYMEKQMRDHGTPINAISRHMIGLFQGERGSKAWRRALSTEPHKPDAMPELLEHALSSFG
jgi:tRNA-dihydrouridine synthase A